MKFIKLTSTSSSRSTFWINMDLIVSIQPGMEGESELFSGREEYPWRAVESPEEIIQLISDATKEI